MSGWSAELQRPVRPVRPDHIGPARWTEPLESELRLSAERLPLVLSADEARQRQLDDAARHGQEEDAAALAEALAAATDSEASRRAQALADRLERAHQQHAACSAEAVEGERLARLAEHAGEDPAATALLWERARSGRQQAAEARRDIAALPGYLSSAQQQARGEVERATAEVLAERHGQLQEEYAKREAVAAALAGPIVGELLVLSRRLTALETLQEQHRRGLPLPIRPRPAPRLSDAVAPPSRTLAGMPRAEPAPELATALDGDRG